MRAREIRFENSSKGKSKYLFIYCSIMIKFSKEIIITQKLEFISRNKHNDRAGKCLIFGLSPIPKSDMTIVFYFGAE